MVKPAECLLMRDIMKSTAKKMAVVLIRILLVSLGVLLFLRIFDIALNFLSHQDFINLYGMLYVIIGLCTLNIIISIFFFWCAYNASSVATEKTAVSEGIEPTDIFIIFGIVFIFMPLVISGVIYVFASYLPGCNLPQGLNCGMYVAFSIGMVVLFFTFMYWMINRY